MNHIEKLEENEDAILRLIKYRHLKRDQRINQEINRLVRENKKIEQLTIQQARELQTLTIEIESEL